MKIKVNLYGEFKKAATSPNLSLEVKEGTTVEGIARVLKLPKTVYMMALVNGFRVNGGQVLKDGDDLHIFQPVGGG